MPLSALKRKLTRAERKQIAAVIARAKSTNKFSAQATIPYLEMFPDGICHVTGKTYSKSVRFDDLTYRLAQPAASLKVLYCRTAKWSGAFRSKSANSKSTGF